jgi:hypothetical protein
VPRLRMGFAFAIIVGLVSFTTAQDKQKFDLKFEKDKVFHQKLTTEVQQTLKVMNGSDIQLNHSQTYYFKWTPIDQTKDGKWEVKQSIEGVTFKFDVAGQTVTYDSTDPNAASGNPGLAEFFKSLVGLEFKVIFNGSTVEKVEGREEALKKMAAVNPQLEQILRKVLSDDALKEMTDPAMGLASGAEQAVGSTWTKEGTLNLGPIGTYARTYEYTYKGKDPTQKELDRIEIKPSITYKAATEGSDGLPFRIKSGNLSVKETKDSYMLYNPKTGRVETARLNVIINGELEVSVNTADAKVTLYQDQKTSLDTSDTSLLPKK